MSIWERLFPKTKDEQGTLDALLDAEYGTQVTPNIAALQHTWFAEFRKHYDHKDATRAIAILDEAKANEPHDGFSWFWYAKVHENIYRDSQKTLLHYLTGAKKCDRMKTGLLQEAAEYLLFECKDVTNATKLFFKAILSVSASTKEWGDSSSMGYLAQERAFQFLQVVLNFYGSQASAEHLMRTVSMVTHLDSGYVATIREILAQSPDADRTRALIDDMFPKLRNRIQQIG